MSMTATPFQVRPIRLQTSLWTRLLYAVVTSVVCLHASAETREACRDSWDKDHEHFIQCVEEGAYDPCDDAGGSRGKAQCAWAYNEIAERKIAKAEQAIRGRLRIGPKQKQALAEFLRSQVLWRRSREAYCNFTNAVEDFESFDAISDFDLGFCKRRLAEQRAAELQLILRRSEQK